MLYLVCGWSRFFNAFDNYQHQTASKQITKYGNNT